MDNHYRKISGYRELNQKEIDLINRVKALGPQIEEVLLDIQIHNRVLHEDDRSKYLNATPARFFELAKTSLQTGLMYATRAIVKPELF